MHANGTVGLTRISFVFVLYCSLPNDAVDSSHCILEDIVGHLPSKRLAIEASRAEMDGAEHRRVADLVHRGGETREVAVSKLFTY